MITLYLVAILLIVNIFLVHLDRVIYVYYWLYTKIIKPKFVVGERVYVGGVEYGIISIQKHEKPYTYYCVIYNSTQKAHYFNTALFHESELTKKTGLLKELE
jgi:cytochrome c-type biogenesis protein CcmE